MAHHALDDFHTHSYVRNTVFHSLAYEWISNYTATATCLPSPRYASLRNLPLDGCITSFPKKFSLVTRGDLLGVAKETSTQWASFSSLIGLKPKHRKQAENIQIWWKRDKLFWRKES